MRPVQNWLTRITQMGTVRVMSQPSVHSIKNQLSKSLLEPQQQVQQVRYLQRVDHMSKKSTALQSMREFFMHPLTWDRNNGFLNVLLALAIFGLCFINACSPCPPDVPQKPLVKDGE